MYFRKHVNDKIIELGREARNAQELLGRIIQWQREKAQQI